MMKVRPVAAHTMEINSPLYFTVQVSFSATIITLMSRLQQVALMDLCAQHETSDKDG